MKQGDWQGIIIVGVIYALAFAITFGLAVLGEPQSKWLWCDALRVLSCGGGL